MKRQVLLCLGLLLSISIMYGQRQTMSLDGEWKFQLDEDSTGWKTWFNGLPDARTVAVPHTWNVEDGLERYFNTAWYQKDINIPADWKGKQVRLRFEAVNRNSVIYLNGKKVGENIGSGYTPFSFDVSKLLKYGSDNRIVVSVNNAFSDFSFPHKTKFDWSNDGGIIRPVSFVVTGKPSVRYAHVKSETSFLKQLSSAEIRIKTWEEGIKKANFKLTFAEYQTKKVILTKNMELTAKNGVFIAKIDFQDIKPWHFDSPNLYTLQVDVSENGKITDTYNTRFGFRNIEIRGDKLYLNDEPVRLAGIEYMPGSYPIYGMAEPVEIMAKAVDLMKELNCIITRFHWQQDERILDLLDEKGMLVQEEIPWWQLPSNLTPEMEALAKKHIDCMIERDFNRPSIFAWGVSNEVSTNTNKDNYKNLIAHARAWNSDAMVTVVSNHIADDLADDESLMADIPTWNDYVGTWHAEVNEDAPGILQSINEKALKGRPLLVTEHGLCEPAFVGGEARRIIDMSYHYDLWAKNDFILGCIYFCLSDYRTFFGESGKGRYQQRVCGLTDQWFGPKPSFNVYKSLASPVYFESVQQSAKGTEADVVVYVKNSLPSYALRNYKLVWKTSSGKMEELVMPDLMPGEKYKTTIKNLNPNEKPLVRVIRPTGYLVFEY